MRKFYHFLLITMMMSLSSFVQSQVWVKIDTSWGCAPLTVKYTVQKDVMTDTVGKTFYWNFYDTVITGNSITRVLQPGRHGGNLSIENCCGAQIPEVKVYGAPKIQTSTGATACPGEKIRLNIYGLDSINWMKWEFGDGKYSTWNWVEHSYSTAAVYQVLLIVNDSKCGTDTSKKTITVSTGAKPVVESRVEGGMEFCPNDQVHFTMSNPEVYDSIEWTFGDGTKSNLFNPTHGYTTNGAKQIITKVWNICGNTASDTNNILIKNNIPVDAGFNYWIPGSPTACPGNQIMFNAFGTGSHIWDFGDGETSNEKNPTHFFVDTGHFKVTLMISNTCNYKDTSDQTIHVQYNPTGNKPDARIYFEDRDYNDTLVKVCPTEKVYFRNDTWSENGGAIYEWQFGDGLTSDMGNADHAWASNGLYKVKMIARNNCLASDTAHLWVNVNSANPPEASFMVMQDSICPNTLMYFIPNNNSKSTGNMKISITYGDGQSDLNMTEGNDLDGIVYSHKYTTAGNFIYKIDATNLCGNTATVFTDTVKVSSSVKKPFYLVMNTAGEDQDPTINLIPRWETRKSVNDFELTIPVNWSEWKDGLDTNFYLIFFDEMPNENSDPLAITKFKGPGDAKAYIPTGTGVDSVLVMALWNCNGIIKRGNGDAVGFYESWIKMTPAGNKTVAFPGIAMKTENWDGQCDDGSSCPGDTVGFFAIGGITYKWNFGDGSATVDGQTAKHVYNNIGTYDAYVIVTNGCGTTDTVKNTVIVGDYNVPTNAWVDIDNSSICIGDTVRFNQNDNGGDGPVEVLNDKYLWNFGDGNTSTDKQPIHVYTTSGTYEVSVTVTNKCGSTTSNSQYIYVDGPVISFTKPVSTILQGDIVPFTNTTMNAVSYKWEFGNDSVSTKKNPSVKYPNFGLYTVSLEATSMKGCKAKLVKENYIDVKKRPIVSDVQIINVTCNGLANGSIDITVTGGQPPYTYLWSNGKTSQDIDNLIAGVYNITITDDIGIKTMASYTVNQPAPLIIDFTNVNETCYGKANGTSTANGIGGNSPYQYQWTTGATSALISNLIHGKYYITVTDTKGCTKYDSTTITSNNAYMNLLTSTTPSACAGATGGASVTGVTGSGSYSYVWSPGGQTANAISNVVAGSYKVIVTDGVSGCKDSAVLAVSETGGPSVWFTAQQDAKCKNSKDGSVTAMSSGGTLPHTYTWNTSPVQSNATATGLGAGTYSVTVKDNNGAGCATVASVTITEPTALSLVVTGTNESCEGKYDGKAKAIVSGGTPGYTYTWSNAWNEAENTGLTVGLHTVTVKDAKNCQIVGSTTLTLPAAISISSTIYNVVVRDSSDGAINISVSNGTAPYTYVWSNSKTSQDIDNIPAGTYSVTVTDSKTCSKVFNGLTVTQPALLNVTITADRALPMCDGETVTLDAGSGYVKYIWSTGSSLQKVVVDTGITVTVKAITNTSYGTASFNVLVNYPYKNEKICIVTVDSATGKNKIVWERTAGKNTKSYKIYKIVGAGNQLIATVPYGDLSTYNDLTSTPESKVDRYVIAVVDSCDHESALSPYHQTMLLQAAKGTSTTEAVLNWNKYTDESGGIAPAYYYIYKGKTKADLALIDSVSGVLEARYNDQMFDGISAYYMVGIKTPICSPAILKAEAGPYSQSLSNIAEFKISSIVDVDENGVSAYPNPFSSVVNVKFELDVTSDVSIEVVNAIGQKTAIFSYDNLAAGSQLISINANAMNINEGVVYLKVVANNKTSIIKCQYIK